MSKKSVQLIQGDVMFIKIDDLPGWRDAKLGNVSPVEGRYIIARGEKTGHAHTIDADKAVYKTLADSLFQGYVTVKKPTTVEHNEHQPLPLEAGVYEVRQQRLYDREADLKKKREEERASRPAAYWD